MARVLVTGGSGFIGGHLVRRLVERGDEVTCLVRPASQVEPLRALGVRLIEGELGDGPSLRRAVNRQQVVYHVAGLTRSLRRRDLMTVNAGGTRRLAEACAAEPNPPVMVQVSSLAAGGPCTAGRCAVEGDLPHPVSDYGRSKLAAERAAAALAGRLPLSIVRPPMVLGEGDRMGLGLFAGVVSFRLHLSPCLARWYFSIIHGADLAELLIRVADQGRRVEPNDPALLFGHHGEAAGLYYAAAEEDLAYADLGRRIAACHGRPTAVVSIASPLVWMAAFCGEMIGQLRGRQVYLNVDKAREVTTGSWTCSPRRARDELGFEPAATLTERLRQTLQWYQAEGWL